MLCHLFVKFLSHYAARHHNLTARQGWPLFCHSASFSRRSGVYAKRTPATSQPVSLYLVRPKALRIFILQSNLVRPKNTDREPVSLSIWIGVSSNRFITFHLCPQTPPEWIARLWWLAVLHGAAFHYGRSSLPVQSDTPSHLLPRMFHPLQNRRLDSEVY